ncbi:hypothetical protein HDU67_002936 [Dinochytrium kinnereticum]|nr:hypothetical protein HDU67_002936 [Dinochytrium kinnereticum]
MSTWQNLAAATLSAVRTHGLKRTFKQIITLDQPRVGTLVGIDALGNEYYENRADIFETVGFSTESGITTPHKYPLNGLKSIYLVALQVLMMLSSDPPHRHQWLHRMTDDIPSESTLPTPSFTPPHIELLTGTSGAFKTYSTVKPKYESWEAAVKPRTQ